MQKKKQLSPQRVWFFFRERHQQIGCIVLPSFSFRVLLGLDWRVSLKKKQNEKKRFGSMETFRGNDSRDRRLFESASRYRRTRVFAQLSIAKMAIDSISRVVAFFFVALGLIDTQNGRRPTMTGQTRFAPRSNVFFDFSFHK